MNHNDSLILMLDYIHKILGTTSVLITKIKLAEKVEDQITEPEMNKAAIIADVL